MRVPLFAWSRLIACTIVLPLALVGATPPRLTLADEPEVKAAVDLYGDPLPAGAAARLGTVRFAHPCSIYSWAYAPDGKMLVSLAEDQVVRFWNTASGRVVHSIDPPPAVIVPWPGRVAVSPDGRLAAVAYGSVWLRIIDLAEAKLLHDIRNLRPDVIRDGWSALGFVGPQPRLFVGSESSGFWLGAETGQVTSREHRGRLEASAPAANLYVFMDGRGGVHWLRYDAEKSAHWSQERQLTISDRKAIALSPDGKTIALAGLERRLREGRMVSEYPSTKIEVYNIATGKLVSLIKSPNTPVDHLTFSPDGRRLAASGPSEAGIWDIESGNRLADLPGSPQHVPLVFSPDGAWLSGADGGATIVEWSTATYRPRAPTHLGRVDAVSFSANGRQVASFSADDGTIRLWDARDGAPSAQVDLPLAKRGELAYTADGKALVVSYSGGVTLRNSSSLQELHSIAAPQGSQSVAFSPDGKIMAFGFSADVFLVTVENGAARWEFSDDGRAAHLEIASQEAEMKLRRTVAGMKTRGANASKVRFSQDGKLLALVHYTDAQRSEVAIWDVAARRQQHLIECEYAVRWVAFLNDGKRLAIAGDRDDEAGELCKIFELEDFECLDSFPVPGASLCAAEFLHKGQVLLIAERERVRSGAAGRLRFLNVSTHAALATLSTGSLTPTALAVSRDEERIAVGGLDGTTLIFETPRLEFTKK